MSTLAVYTAAARGDVRRLRLGDPLPNAPACEWCASRRAAVALDEEPFCTECLAELVTRGRRA